MGAPNLAVQTEPVEGGTLRYQRLAATSTGAAGGAKLIARLAITNNEAATIEITGITFRFPGASAPAVTMQGVPLVLGDGGKIDTGETRLWSNGNVELADGKKVNNAVYLALPAPKTLAVEISTAGFDTAFSTTIDLSEHNAPVAGGGYPMPFATADLRQAECATVVGSHWANGGAPGTQIYALDIGISGWDAKAKAWRETLPGTDGTKNEHYRGWGLPVRAMADGTVISVDDGMADNTKIGSFPKPTPNPAGGNNVWIDHGDERIVYTHLQKGSIPKALTPGAKVKAGQVLGSFGNSGNSSNPHIHLEVRRDSDSALRPLDLAGAWLIDQELQKPYDPDGPWVQLDGAGIPNKRVLVWPSAQRPTHYPPGWAELSRHGLRSSDYQAFFDQATSSGYRPVWLDGFEHGGTTYFNVIFRPSDGVQWSARHGMTGEQYQADFDKRTKAGLRLVNLASYLEGSSLRYAAIWEKRSGPAWRAYHGRSSADHQQLFDQYVKEGYRPVNIAVTTVGGKRVHAAFYEKADVGGLWVKSGITPDQYQAEWSTQVAKNGMHVAYLTGFQESGPKLSVIFQSKAPGSGGSAGRHNLDGAGYQAAFEEMLGKGLLTRCVAGYSSGRKALYAGIWRA